MFRKTRLFTPGPTPLLPAAQFAMAAADLHHRTPEFRDLYLKVLAQLKVFIGTRHDVVVLASSGTGAMEAAVSNLTSPGDKVLVLTAGKFGERWVSLAKAFHCETVVLSKPYGQTFSIEEVQALLTPDVKAVFVQATETSTGVRHDVSALAKLVKGTDALLVVDAITGLGTTAFDVDGDGIDVIIGGSQKALMIPPGLAYLAASQRAWARMETSTQPRYYFDLRKERKSCAKGESAYTPVGRPHRRHGRGPRLPGAAGKRRPRQGTRPPDCQRRALRPVHEEPPPPPSGWNCSPSRTPPP